jgi:hypothetical protein
MVKSSAFKPFSFASQNVSPAYAQVFIREKFWFRLSLLPFAIAFFYFPSLDLEAGNSILKTGNHFDRSSKQSKCSGAAESRAGDGHSSAHLFLRHKRQSNDFAIAALDGARI